MAKLQFFAQNMQDFRRKMCRKMHLLKSNFKNSIIKTFQFSIKKDESVITNENFLYFCRKFQNK